MALIEIVNDIHATRRPPSSCTDSYWPDLLDLMRQTVDVAVQREVSAVVWAGDVFHHKAPSRTDHAVVRSLIEVGQAYPCPWAIVPGNHDIQYDRLASIDVTQPLGVLFRAGARRLEGWGGPDEDSRLDLYGVPWLQDWSEQGIAGALDGWRGESYGCSLVVTHAPIYPPGREPRYEGAECTPASWWAEAMGGFGYLAYGHIHEPHGVWQHGGVTFCNFGALSRGSLDEYNLNREVGVTLWDTDAAGPAAFEFVPLRARPAADVFRLQEHDEVVTARRSLETFAAGVGAVSLSLLSVESVAALIRALPGVDAETAGFAEELLMRQGGS